MLAMATHQSLSETYRTMPHLRRLFESVRRTITKPGSESPTPKRGTREGVAEMKKWLAK
jgi:hypothetical protein